MQDWGVAHSAIEKAFGSFPHIISEDAEKNISDDSCEHEHYLVHTDTSVRKIDAEYLNTIRSRRPSDRVILYFIADLQGPSPHNERNTKLMRNIEVIQVHPDKIGYHLNIARNAHEAQLEKKPH